ncbi:MAG: CDP-alcohol phosphatidyltransferase family protein [Planctomycetes bacterium]|nr:CDP-alcohol phosphatidyltransferase family protein [Planctomycetota bacterium]
MRETGEAPGISKTIGQGFCDARDAVARVLIRLGATPNRLTILGFVMTCGAGYCLARGADQQVPYFYSGDGPVGWWPAWAALFVFLSGACDMLDGAVARVGGMHTRFGAILDSIVDRLSDMAIFLGCAAFFALRGNLTYALLAMAALCNAVLISYIKARAETVIADCSAGYWLRGERFAALLIGCTTGHMPAVLWQLTVLGFLTVVRRINYARLATTALDRNAALPPRGPDAGWPGHFQPWRHPRGTIQYDIVTGLNIAFIVMAPRIWPTLLPAADYADPLRAWLAG